MANHTNASDKIAIQQKKADTPMECPKCGSTFFMRADCARYSNVGYGSAEFKLLTTVPLQAIICLCGYLVKPATAPTAGIGTAQHQFYESVVKAVKYQSTLDLNAVKQELAQQFIGTDDYNEVIENLEDIDRRVHAIESNDEPSSEIAGEEIELDHSGKQVKKSKGKKPNEV